MRSARLVLALAALCAGAATVAPAPLAAQAPAPQERIAAGLTVQGLAVGGLTVEQAAQLIDATFRARLEQGIVAAGAGRTLRLTAAAAKLRFDPLTSAKRALYAGRAAAGAPANVALAVTYSKAAVRRFAGRVDRRLSRAPRAARLRITLRRVSVSHSRPGRDIDELALAGQIGAALADPSAGRFLRPKLLAVRPQVTADRLRRSAGTVITIDRAHFKLRLFKRLALRKSYPVAVGQPAYPTPTGRFTIQTKQVNPTWSVPSSPWAGELAGTTVVGGSAANPLKARWMGIASGVGIHGTGEDYSIGTRASHGCIRMHVRDVVDLYPRVPVGTPVLIR